MGEKLAFMDQSVLLSSLADFSVQHQFFRIDTRPPGDLG